MTVQDLTAVEAEIARLEKDLSDQRERLTALKRQLPKPVVADHELQGPNGPVMLSELFGDRTELILIHNMGRGCPYCTMWADGLNGVVAHLENRAAFVVASPDTPEVQQAFAESRGWKFRMVSTAGSDFTQALGYADDQGLLTPGVSVFHKAEDGTLSRSGKAVFGPGDDFCAVWHLFDLLPEGAGDWHPRLHY